MLPIKRRKDNFVCGNGHEFTPALHLCPICYMPPVHDQNPGKGFVCPDHNVRAVLITDGLGRSGFYFPCCDKRVDVTKAYIKVKEETPSAT